MTESFLHYVWQLQYFRKDELKTSSGEPVRVYHPGTRNADAGPDFSNARVKIGELEWRGSVEIHLRASGWHDHRHSADEAYEKVILHVVWENDKPVKRTDGSEMPTLELKDRMDFALWERYKNLYTSADVIPCANHWQSVPALTTLSALDNALMIRLQAKAALVTSLLAANNNNWDQTSYQLLCKNFGFKVNAEPMLRLAQILPYTILLKHFDKPVQVEALLFGVAGFLENDVADNYTLTLKREYNVLRKKYSLDGRQMNLSQWKFLRLRPANFPTIRIAQLAGLLTKQKHLFSKIVETTSGREVYDLLDVDQSAYWLRHYQFGKPSKADVPPLGDRSIQNIVINTVVPLLVSYGKIHNEQAYITRATDLLQEIPAENNRITRQWLSLDYKVQSAFDSQALVELYTNFCMKRRCLECGVGSWLIKS
ncbi:MAG TPA: DUF2851 family protein [Cyclobacteriaceae bacterium]|nr:DUF2851 family protein [Cyclobacteriaceae bacterium]